MTTNNRKDNDVRLSPIAQLYGGPFDGRVLADLPRGYDGMPGPHEIQLVYLQNMAVYQLVGDRMTYNIGRLRYDYVGEAETPNG